MFYYLFEDLNLIYSSKGKTPLKFIGFGYGPNINADCPLSYPKANPRVYLFNRHIIHKPMSPIPVFVKNLLKHIK